MIELVFSDSACGSLKMAQHYGEGPFKGCTCVILGREDGAEPEAEEWRYAQKRAEEAQRREWNQAVPMGGNPQDVYGMHLGLSVGDIAEEEPGEKRRTVLETLFCFYPGEEGKQAAGHLLSAAKSNLAQIRIRMEAGESIRIWYSDQPDELCGFYWILDQLECLRQQTPLGAVYGVKLPVWERIGEDKVRVRNSWGEVSPGEWSGYLSLQERLPEGFCRACADVWRQLRRENGSLRAVLNGRLVSVPDSLYDTFLMRELQTLEGEFSEAEWIGRVLGNYNLGIGDGWLALRIEEKIRAGELEIVREAENSDPRYHRILRKKSETGTF